MQGFTLLELLAALALLAMIATLALPLLRPAPAGLRMEDIARKMAGGLRLARAEAIGGNEDRVFTVDTSRKTYESNATGIVQLPGEIAIDLVVADGEKTGPARGGFRFHPGGGSTGGSIHLKLDAREAHIEVGWLSGEARVR